MVTARQNSTGKVGYTDRMAELRPEKVRDARILARQAEAVHDAESLIAAARDLRVIGRPDLSLRVLDRCRQIANSTTLWRLERCLTLAALARPEEALQAVRGILDTDPDPPASLRLIAAFAEIPGMIAIDQANVRKLLSETVVRDDPVSILSKMPLKAIGHFPLIRLFGADLRLPAHLRARLWARAIGSKIRFRVFDLVALCLLALVKLRYWRWDIHVSSLGNFTRLADIVDRVDPVLRRLRDRAGSRQPPLLIALYFDGYPNETLMRLYLKHCRLVRVPGALPKKLIRAAFSVVEQVGRDLALGTDYRRIKDDFMGGPPVLCFPDHEARVAEEQLALLGIDPEKPIVCFGLRDMAYYKFYGTVMGSGPSAGARDDTEHRCPPILPYANLAHYWADRGYQVVRMGLCVTEPLPGGDHPLVFDYARSERSDELDVYLFSRCTFLLAGDTGLFSGAAAFDRPTVVSDLFLIRNTIYSSNKMTPSIFVPKLAFDQEEGRYLSFSEWLYFNHLFSFAKDCERAGFKLVHNTAEDLIDATCELIERLDGRYQETDEDKELQRRFHGMFAPYQVGFGSTGLVSAAFLRKHSDLLN